MTNKRSYTAAFSPFSSSGKPSKSESPFILARRPEQTTFSLDSDDDDDWSTPRQSAKVENVAKVAKVPLRKVQPSIEDKDPDEELEEEYDHIHDPEHDEQYEESTDYKLALLSSIHPTLPAAELLELLLSCNGSVEEATLAVTTNGSPRKKALTAPGMQSALSSYFGSKGDSPGSPASGTALAISASKPRIPFPLPAIPKGKTIHISTVEDVPYNSPCTMRAPFLPSQLATTLLHELLEESKNFERPKFRLFERNVQSPHTIALFVGNAGTAFMQKSDYLYNGTYLTDVRTFTPTMAKIATIVEEVVRKDVAERIKNVYPGGKKLRYQMSPEKWRPTHAFVNCYDGGKESVGWHSDQLTYLGPRTIIASLSLGVEREFRLRRVAPSPPDIVDDDDDDDKGPRHSQQEVKAPPASQEEIEAEIKDTISASRTSPWAELEGSVSLHLPHNSLVIMHAETQESFKHSIHPANTITPHPIAGNKRINITYRFYRESLHPTKTPKCLCGLPSILRTVQRKEDNMGRYFWMCHAGNAPDGTNCSFFKWAEFDSEGEPIWDEDDKEEGK